jgi:hypothetical protein
MRPDRQGWRHDPSDATDKGRGISILNLGDACRWSIAQYNRADGPSNSIASLGHRVL